MHNRSCISFPQGDRTSAPAHSLPPCFSALNSAISIAPAPHESSRYSNQRFAHPFAQVIDPFGLYPRVLFNRLDLQKGYWQHSHILLYTCTHTKRVRPYWPNLYPLRNGIKSLQTLHLPEEIYIHNKHIPERERYYTSSILNQLSLTC